VIDRDTLLEAHRDPLRYPDLVVRVTGFTAYFALLSPAFRQLVVDRLLSEEGKTVASVRHTAPIMQIA
jgi:pyruvate-formate lyase